MENRGDLPPIGRRGAIMAIGGAEDRAGERRLLGRFIALAGGPAARIAIVPAASGLAGAGQFYRGAFRDLGAASAEVIQIPDRAAALDPATAAPLARATGIYLSGGNQLRLAALLGGSPVEAAIRARLAAGAVVAGTSAGASILSTHMVAFGEGGTSPRGRMAQLAAGFGLLPGAIVDQHFRERDRIGRLLMLVALNPGLLGLGIDEDTAAIVDAGDVLTVLGSGTVMIVDGQGMTSDIAGLAAPRPVSVTDVILHALADGRRYDLRARRPFPAAPRDEPRAGGQAADGAADRSGRSAGAR